MSHIENGRYWAQQAIDRAKLGDHAGARACHANAAHYAGLEIADRIARERNVDENFRATVASALRGARYQRAWNGGNRH